MHALDGEANSAERGDETARRILNLLFILNSSTTPLSTEQIVEDSDLGYGSGVRDSDMRKFRRDRERLAEHGIFIREVAAAGDAQNESSSWEIDRERTHARIGLISHDDADTLLCALRDALKMPQAPYRPLILDCYRRLSQQLAATAATGALLEENAADRRIDSTLWEAFVHRRTVRLSYTDAKGASSNKLFNIYGMFAQQGNAYVVGLDLERDGIRTLRLDRIERVWRPKGSYKIPADFSVSDYLFLPLDLSDKPAQPVRFSFPKSMGTDEVRAITHGRGSLSLDESHWLWDIDAHDIAAAARMAAGHAACGMRPIAPTALIDCWNALIQKGIARHENR